MTAGYDHDAVRAALPAAALGALEAGEAELVARHAEHCVACAELLTEYRDTVGELERLTPERQMDTAMAAEVRTRLLARAGAAHERGRTASLVTTLSGWAVAAGLAALLVSHHAFHRPLQAGWLAAALFAVLAGVAGVYAARQRQRARALARSVDRLEGRRAELERGGS